jgi:hypothetical protein
VTDIPLFATTVKTVMKGGRARWKIESAPQAHKVVVEGFITKCCKAIGKMVVGPPKSAVRSRFQTTLSGYC